MIYWVELGDPGLAVHTADPATGVVITGKAIVCGSREQALEVKRSVMLSRDLTACPKMLETAFSLRDLRKCYGWILYKGIGKELDPLRKLLKAEMEKEIKKRVENPDPRDTWDGEGELYEKLL